MKKFISNAANRRFLMVLPLLALPFLCLIFFSLGGGRGVARVGGATAMGLNTQLPAAHFNPKQAFLNKLGLYEKAERDSLRQKQYQRQDPYRRDSSVRLGVRSGASVGGARAPIVVDPKAEELLQRLDRLKLSWKEPSTASKPNGVGYHRNEEAPVQRRSQDSVGTDPKVNQLNTLLDKVIRIQHPEESHANKSVVSSRGVEEVAPADTGVNAIAAVIPTDQTLTTGTTIALRLEDSIRVGGQLLAPGQFLYGVVQINNDRMLIHIDALRAGRNLFATDLQVYDMDGLAGIHIPGVLSRDVAKQSAEQGVNALDVMNVDPSIAVQAASAGIQTAKSFVGRKVRQVRVSVRAGYQVLLRDPRINSRLFCFFHKEKPDEGLRPPGFVPGGQILNRCHVEGLEVDLRGIWLDRGCLWVGLEWANRSPIGFTPAYTRWFVRDRRRFRRTAEQELPLEPVCIAEPPLVTNDSAAHGWTGFMPFAIGKDKELVMEVGEKGGGRMLTLTIGDKEILKAKNVQP